MKTLIKKIILIIFLSNFFLGCKTKKVQKDFTKTEERIENKFFVKQDSFISKKQNDALFRNVNSFENKKEDNSNIEIKSKVDKENPFQFFNIKDGDTINSIKIVGIADVFYKSNQSYLHQVKKDSSVIKNNNEESLEKNYENTENSILNKVKEVQNKTVSVVKKDFQVGTYITFFLLGLALIIGCIILVRFKIPSIFTNFLK